MLTACQSLVPATTPPQLSQTPGAAIIITDNQIDAGWFTLDYPEGWRVVTNVAIEPLRLTLVSPDDEIVIIIEDAHGNCFILETTPEFGKYLRRECIRDNEDEMAVLYITGEPDTEFQAIYNPIFDSVVNSVRFR